MPEQRDFEQLEDRVTALEHTTWGVRGDNGMVLALRELTREFREARAEDQRRREEEAKESRGRARAIVATAVSATIAMIGMIITLIIVLTTQGP